MKIGADSVICRIVEVGNLISVTHTSNDQTGRRINDIHSVDDLLLALPTLTAPIVEAIPYEANYYDKWARVSRSERASRGSIRPVTVTVKSCTLLHSVPTAPQTSTDAPASPHRKPNSHKASITSCKSLDNIIEQYNKMFPSENEKEAKCNAKVAKNKNKTLESHENDTVQLHLNHQHANNGDNLGTTANLTPVSSQHILRNNKSISRDSSPKRKHSVSSSMERLSVSPDRSALVDKPSKKNTLQVPLPTGLVCIQWPSALPTSDTSLKSTQFPMCSPKKNGSQVIPRIKTPELYLREQDTSTHQINSKGVAKKVEELKLMQISSSSLVASQCSRRNSFELRPNYTTSLSPGLSPEPRSPILRRFSTQSNVTFTKDVTPDYIPHSSHEHNIRHLDTNSPGRKCNSGNLLRPRDGMCTLNLPIDVLAPTPNSPREVSKERNHEIQSACRETGNKSEVVTLISDKEPKFYRKKRPKSRQCHENTKHSSDERQSSSKSTHPKHIHNGPPMVQFLDLKNLQYIFDKAAKVRRP